MSSIECPQWRSSIFSRYINNQASVDDLATLHNHFNECTLCYQRFLAPMKEAMELAYQDNLAKEDAPAQKDSWQLFKKDLIAIAQQANAEDISFDLAYQQLVEAQSLHSQNIDYLASLASEEVAHLLDDSGGRVAVFPPAKQAYKRKQLLADVFKVAAIILLAVAPFTLVWKSGLLKSYTTISQSETKVKATRYELIDSHIDNYLQARNRNDFAKAADALREAEQVAQDMSNKTQDLYGQDLVAYYRSLPAEYVAESINGRKLVEEANSILLRNQSSKITTKAQEAQRIFEKLGADIELEKIHFILAKALTHMGKLPEAQVLVDKYQDKVKQKQHLLSYAQSLYNQSDILGEKVQYAQEIKLLNESINITTSLDIPEFSAYLQADLAKIYFVTNNDQEAIKEAEEALVTYKGIKNYHLVIELSQVAGLSSYNLKDSAVSQTYLKDSITLAQGQQDWPYLIQGYWMLGLVKAQELDFVEADKFFNLALETIPKIDDPSTEKYLKAVVTGYYGRKEILAKNYEQAIELYTSSIKLTEDINKEQKLILSQLHQGLGEGLLAIGKRSEGSEQIVMAKNLSNQAEKNLEQNNNLLTFAPINKNAADMRLNTP